MNNEGIFDEVIFKLFNNCWCGPQSEDVELAKKQLLKNLTDQVNGYWSGSTAYYIMTTGGFLIDGKKGTKKKLTAIGEMFVENMKNK